MDLHRDEMAVTMNQTGFKKQYSATMALVFPLTLTLTLKTLVL